MKGVIIMNRKALSLLLALLMAASSLTGCAESPAETEPSQTQTPGVSADTTPAETLPEETGISDDLPAKNFDGAEFSILTTTWYNAKTYIYADEMNGEVVNDALFNQRAAITDRFNVEILCTAEDDYGVVGSTVHNLVISGDDTYDIVYNHDNQTMSNALQGDFCNLRKFELLDFEKPWWQGASQVFTIQNKLFATANPLALSGIYMNCTISINKDLAGNLQMEVPYEKVRNGEWYLDDLQTMAEAAMRDLDGDGDLDAEDQWGFLTSDYGWIHLQSDMGAGILDKDAEGKVFFVNDIEKLVNVMEKFDKLSEFTQTCPGTDYNVAMFSEGRGLFMLSENRNLYETMRDSDVAYGILPCPKFNELQENYASSGFDIYWGVILTSAANEELISYCVEALSCKNYNDVVPEVWETVLGSKLADAPDDRAMFEIIRDIQYVDLGFAFQGAIGGINQLVFLKTNATANTTSSLIGKSNKAIKKNIEKFNNTFAEMGE